MTEATSISSDIRDILDFWLLPLSDPSYGKKRELWWMSTPELDAEMTARFSLLLPQAAAGYLDGWAHSANGALALILLCDQFSRNIYRKTARAFATDPKALEIARIALTRLYPAAYPPAVRIFFYMPFGHSERMADQNLACELIATVDGGNGIKAAIEHRDVVAKYGRFPHRNEVLGRTSSPEEREYLQKAARWGQ